LLCYCCCCGVQACGSSGAKSCHAATRSAVAYLTPHGSGYNVFGVISLEQSGANLVISGNVTGLNASQQYGFHIHESGDLSTGCGGALGHYNPYGKDHGAPTDSDRHVGDFGNIVGGSDGVTRVSITDSVASLVNTESVLGRSIVIHAGVDDLGRGGHPSSKTTGNAGARMACGVIGVK
ncbi:hypothetical protein BOX15_Mlig014161g1, partial [Macrostomum lignano]